MLATINHWFYRPRFKVSFSLNSKSKDFGDIECERYVFYSFATMRAMGKCIKCLLRFDSLFTSHCQTIHASNLAQIVGKHSFIKVFQTAASIIEKDR